MNTCIYIARIKDGTNHCSTPISNVYVRPNQFEYAFFLNISLANSSSSWALIINFDKYLFKKNQSEHSKKKKEKKYFDDFLYILYSVEQ